LFKKISRVICYNEINTKGEAPDKRQTIRETAATAAKIFERWQIL
jgi:hypothetical protein